jgi:TolB protein
MIKRLHLFTGAALALSVLYLAAIGATMVAARGLLHGDVIAFSARGFTTQDVFIQDMNTGIARNLTWNVNKSHHESQPAWSPDGLQIVFASTIDPYAPTDLYVMDMDGKNLRQLTNFIGGEFSPVWSPDGREIAFVSLQEGKLEIFVTDANGGNVRQVTENPASTSGYNITPSWSPDGQHLVFQSLRDGRNSIFTIDNSGANEQRLLDGNFRVPAWSPDNTHIAVVGGSEERILIVGLVDGNLAPLEIMGVRSSLTWLPSGHHLAYVSTSCPGCDAWVSVIDLLTGREDARFLFDGSVAYAPAWRPS